MGLTRWKGIMAAGTVLYAVGASYYLAGVARAQSVAPTPAAVTWMATLWPFLPVVYGPALFVIWRASLRRRAQALASAALAFAGPWSPKHPS